MYDRRVVRGNTYAAQVVPANAIEEQPAATNAGSTRRAGQAPTASGHQGKSMKRMKTDKLKDTSGADVAAVEGRRHADVQTDQYLEVLEDVIPEHDNATQTDAFNDRPPTPMFIQAKTGLDVATQVEDGELFDFDLEVAPLLEVLVGKTIEQSFTEVLEEEELRAMRDHQEYFEQVRTAELVATQRMEAEERRKANENARRVKQEEERIAREKAVRTKISSVLLARGYLTGVFDVVFDKLYEDGTFYDPSVKEVEDDFLPLLTAMVTDKVTQNEISREIMRKIVREAVIKSAMASKKTAEAEASSSRATAEDASTISEDAGKCLQRIGEARKQAAAVPTLLLEEATEFVKVEDVTSVRAELASSAQAVADELTEKKKEKAAAKMAALEADADASEEAAKAAALAAEECQSEMMAALTNASAGEQEADGHEKGEDNGQSAAGAGADEEPSASTSAGAEPSSDMAALESRFNELKDDADEKLAKSAEARAAFESAKEELSTIADELPAPISDEATLMTLFSKEICSETDAKDVLAMIDLGAAAHTRVAAAIAV